MNKRLTIILAIITLFILITAGLTLLFSSSNNNSMQVISFEEAADSNKPTIVLFYNDWCSNCVKFAPRFNSLYSTYKDDFNFVTVNTEDPKYQSLVSSHVVLLPSMYIFDSKINNKVHINQSFYNDINALRIELDRYLRIRSMVLEK